MRRALRWLPFVVLVLFALGVARELSERDDAIPHFELMPEDELRLSFAEPFGERELTGTLTGSGGETLFDALLYVDHGDTPFWDRTDAAGRFELRRLPPGPWRVVVTARGYRPQVFEVPDDGIPHALSLATPLAPFEDPPELARGDLAGRLFDPNQTDADLAGYELSLRPTAPLEEWTTPLPRRVVAGADGAFELAGLSAGRYRVQVLPPWARGGVWPDLCSAAERELVFDPAAPASPLLVALERGEIHGRLTDAKGRFLEGALVVVEEADDPSRVWPTFSTSREGSFLATDLPPGAYRVRARAGAGEAAQVVEVRAGLTLNLDLDPLTTRDPGR